MLAPGCCDAASEFLDARIVMNDLFGMVFAGLASMQHEMARDVTRGHRSIWLRIFVGYPREPAG